MQPDEGSVRGPENASLIANLEHLDLSIQLVDAGDVDPDERHVAVAGDLMYDALELIDGEASWVDDGDFPGDVAHFKRQATGHLPSAPCVR